MKLTLPGGGIFQALAGKSPALRAGPPPPPPLPQRTDPSVQRAQEESRLAAQRRKGFSDTIKTNAGLGGPGVQATANVQRSTLLG